MENIPFYVYATFVLTLVATMLIFYRATKKSKGFIVLITVWLTLQSIIGILGFYTTNSTTPPKLPFLLVPPLVFIIVLFSTRKGRLFIDSLDLKTLTIIHIVRIPIEFVLYWLFLSKAVPELMTFEGRNFDIISGLTAPFIYYFGFIKISLNKSILIGWNLICMALLLNIVLNAMLSAPTLFQKFGFQQPNIAVLHLPFLFLPACIVPIILFAHLASIRQLILNKSQTK